MDSPAVRGLTIVSDAESYRSDAISYTGYLFINVFDTSWQPYPSTSVRRQHRRTSAVTYIAYSELFANFALL